MSEFDHHQATPHHIDTTTKKFFCQNFFFRPTLIDNSKKNFVIFIIYFFTRKELRTFFNDEKVMLEIIDFKFFTNFGEKEEDKYCSNAAENAKS